MTPADYMLAALRTEFTPEISAHSAGKERPINARLLHAALGLCTETGELQDAIKKDLIYGKALDHVNVIEELGDIAWYLNLAIAAVGSSWEEVFERNIAKLKKRFPDKFTQEAALNRDLAAERVTLEETPKVPGDYMFTLNGRPQGRASSLTTYAQLCALANIAPEHQPTITIKSRVQDTHYELLPGQQIYVDHGMVINVVPTSAG